MIQMDLIERSKYENQLLLDKLLKDTMRRRYWAQKRGARWIGVN